MSYTSLVHSFLSPWLSLIYTWTFPFLGPGLYIIHPRANHLSPWYIICLVQGYVTYILGVFPCMFLVHPFLSAGLSFIYLDHLHACFWYIIFSTKQMMYLSDGCMAPEMQEANPAPKNDVPGTCRIRTIYCSCVYGLYSVTVSFAHFTPATGVRSP
jgi:hypothetical protein